ncbi:RecQ family ATP-dependent DNA helicase [Microbulbifer agarilyticus]
MDKARAEQLLQTALGRAAASFREGQWEAIDALVNRNRKLLVVQRTGWGKSSVYFISTRIFRDRGLGPTIIVSPLLALMRNQIESAERLGINAKTMNSTNQQDWELVTQQILRNEVDCLLISPERLANDDFVETVLLPVADQIAMMVVDEAHCISDWGHDFRPDYRRIVNILKQLPANTPVLGTTATANNRVVADIQSQLGDIDIQRGPLIRESLALQTLSLPDQASRLAWLASHIPELPGTGIVYTLTTRDAEQVADWLNQNGILAKAYHGSITDPAFVDRAGKPDSNTYRQHLEELLLRNDIKVLVATTALGMGYDKPDLGFVVHFQAPGSIVSYYQQVGRAGRGIDYAVGVLMSGTEDDEIHEFFRTNAFPSLEQINEILDALDSQGGLSIPKLEEFTNLRRSQIEKVLKLLRVENPAPLIKVDSKWHRTANPFTMDTGRIEHLTRQRKEEWEQVQGYIRSSSCLMSYLRSALDDEVTGECGKCSPCLGRQIVNTSVDTDVVHRASTFVKQAESPIAPRKQIPRNALRSYGLTGNLPATLQAQEGRVLSRWGDAGWGHMVAEDKHRNRFRDELVASTADMILNRWQPEEFPSWVCPVPSLNHPELVPDFARRLASALDLPYVEAIEKVRANQPQKGQQNGFHQCHNLDGAFRVCVPLPPGNVLLVDDVVDSRWTLTVLAALLQQAGGGKVYPVALASASTRDE